MVTPIQKLLSPDSKANVKLNLSARTTQAGVRENPPCMLLGTAIRSYPKRTVCTYNRSTKFTKHTIENEKLYVNTKSIQTTRHPGV